MRLSNLSRDSPETWMATGSRVELILARTFWNKYIDCKLVVLSFLTKLQLSKWCSKHPKRELLTSIYHLHLKNVCLELHWISHYLGPNQICMGNPAYKDAISWNSVMRSKCFVFLRFKWPKIFPFYLCTLYHNIMVNHNQNCFHFHFNEAGNAEADTVSFNSEVSDFAGA